MEPIDGLAFIGHNPMDFKNVFVATGDSGNGITHGTIAGILLADLIAGRKNRWEGLYDPSRVPISSANKFAKDAMDVVSHYGDFFAPGADPAAMDLKVGDGAVFHRGLKRIAVCKDQNGVVHEFSAFCPHLGCIVMWNHAEETWDCPCHGSRFAGKDGHVLNGPANVGLTKE
jgi:Rieske Fe-S protein